ncbi:hypothetical protein [Helicobacter pylori]|uniref:Uncharacterized protein n=2 Tax=Helicobacter pylori TaxID=210 RepID=J0KDN3_HELPX|nr:hypothetical protein [Helicobacter pylori]EJB48872.1 hypothetical protein HPHPH24_1429 [Helicobacter pylori Hp H-24]EJC16888.1 hypothetical protein HPHPH24B_1293 [Helicobacter pylori Hp H-24b]EJC44681.1 hypothetical protein HPHPM5_1704 [Helicobacter pylori Hp M5]EJC46066.1 hypothetical protein HPHPM6_1426 [Helicobacter pylori Hp M6]EJC59821.1 hypothetical protein HPHPM9_1206 [Helicobacter pylori Hp M9]
MPLDFSNLNEEPLKIQIKAEFFKDEKFRYSGDKIDFMLSYQHPNATLPVLPILWGEAKRRDFDDLDKAFTQLLLTIGKHKLYTHHTPPYLCAFNAFRMEFIAFNDTITSFFYKSDIDFSIPPSNHNTEGFKHALDAFKAMCKPHKLVFDFKTQSQECKEFIKKYLNSSHLLNKIQIDKNNFFTIYQKWLEIVKPTIKIGWELAKAEGILDADYYLADLLSDGDKTIIEKLRTILKSSHYELKWGSNTLNKLGLEGITKVGFTDSQQAHQEFWSVYERPPQLEFQASILERRDLLVPSDVRERKGAYFTPKIWVEKSQEYLAKALGQDYQEDYIIWDCAGGTGNLLRGLLNKANLYLSTLDHNDVAIIKDLASKNHLKLLENQVFQFDFLNDDFFSDKLPKSLQEILKDEEKRKRLIIYINPPYAEAGNKAKMSGTGEHKAKVARNNKVYETYKDLLGSGTNELFAQFFMRIYKELDGCIMASFSKLKYLNSSHFKKFREVFKAKFLEGFMVPADSFDNVTGQFPIGFLVWDTATPPPLKPTNAFNLEVFDSSGGFLGYKTFKPIVDKVKNINEWFKAYKDKRDYLGILVCDAPDFSHQNTNYLQNHKGTSHLHYENLTLTNLLIGAIYFSIRHCIKATWQNDRDQFYAPYDDAFQDDREFKNNCLAFMLFHTQNRITATQGTNHFIPFSEDEVDSKERYSSHALLDFLKGEIKESKESDSLFLNAKKENKPLKFSPSASKVFDAGKEIYRYYHKQDFTHTPYNANASLYDIKEFFQGRNKQGRLNSRAKAKDEYYKQLYANLQYALKDLAKEIQPKVYEYGFLRE